MGFIESYKHLEKLCSEIMSDNYGVSAYIEEMVNTPRGSLFVKGWEEDLKQLKHYRWIRNRISHDPNCSEENMCNPADVKWVADFYSRIMKQTDPLAMYRKATRPSSKSALNNVYKPIYQEKSQCNYKSQTVEQKSFGCGKCLLISFIVAVAVVATIVILSILLK